MCATNDDARTWPFVIFLPSKLASKTSHLISSRERSQQAGSKKKGSIGHQIIIIIPGMMAKDRIWVGSTVSAAVCLLIDDPSGENKQRRRARFTGTVLCSAKNQQWMVFWHDIQKACDHAPSILKIESSTGDLLSIESLNVEAILKDSYVENINNFLAT